MSKNHLSEEKSLYLKQHAENPIHWWAYGEEPLALAKAQNKPLFLSIGYSSCHWCHVMAHESFEDQATADFLNENFVSIKIDREEYPDLDHYYQTACSLMTGRGGWPLTVFLTAEGKPFFAGTYFPKVGRQGMPSFMEVLKHVQKEWQEKPQTFKDNAEKFIEEIRKPQRPEKKIEFQGHFPPPSAILNAMKNFADAANGGYGKAPKFPHFPFYEWACEQILEGMIPKEQGQHIVETIERMLMGGLYDHAKGGIHRYSVDEKFLVPHFEKMLYDQAGLLKVLSKLGQFYPAPLIFDGILQTIDYLKSEMIADEGYFFSAQDADSEGVEGLYFTFSKEEFESVFEEAPEELRAKKDYYLKVFNITEKGNFEHGLNVISLNRELRNEYYSQEGWDAVRELKRRLLEQRKFRMPPATDRKGIAGWNFMMLAALADVVQYCPVAAIQNEAFDIIKQTVEGAIQQFVQTGTAEKNHAIKHTNTLDKAALYLEDYVSFADCQLRLYEVSGNEVFKLNTLQTAEFIIKNFLRDGVLYVTALEAATAGIENLESPLYDQSYRSASMTFTLLLTRISLINPELHPEKIFGPRYAEYAQSVLTNPLGHGEGLRALTYPLQIFRKIEVPLKWLDKPEFQEMRSHFFSRFLIDYHNREDESFQICTRDACEAQGKGFEDFHKLFQVQETTDDA